MAPCSGRAKGARKTHFKGYWLVVFTMQYAETERAPCNGRASIGSWQGWNNTRVNWGSNPQPSTRVN